MQDLPVQQGPRGPLNRLADIVVSSGTSVYAWSLLQNHAHFLLRTGKVGLSRAMRRLLTGYAVSFNRRHKRVGHLFQNRFKSIIVEEGSYLLELVRYIHLNPLRVGLVRNVGELDEYRWTGHGALMGEVERAWQDVDYVLEQFGVSECEARRAYREFVSEGVSEGRRPDLVGGGLIRSIGGRENLAELRRGRERWAFDERVLGSSRFVVQLWEEGERRASVGRSPETEETVGSFASCRGGAAQSEPAGGGFREPTQGGIPMQASGQLRCGFRAWDPCSPRGEAAGRDSAERPSGDREGTGSC